MCSCEVSEAKGEVPTRKQTGQSRRRKLRQGSRLGRAAQSRPPAHLPPPLFADFGPGLEAVADGRRAAGREVLERRSRRGLLTPQPTGQPHSTHSRSLFHASSSQTPLALTLSHPPTSVLMKQVMQAGLDVLSYNAANAAEDADAAVRRPTAGRWGLRARCRQRGSLPSNLPTPGLCAPSRAPPAGAGRHRRRRAAESRTIAGGGDGCCCGGGGAGAVRWAGPFLCPGRDCAARVYQARAGSCDRSPGRLRTGTGTKAKLTVARRPEPRPGGASTWCTHGRLAGGGREAVGRRRGAACGLGRSAIGEAEGPGFLFAVGE